MRKTVKELQEQNAAISVAVSALFMKVVEIGVVLQDEVNQINLKLSKLQLPLDVDFADNIAKISELATQLDAIKTGIESVVEDESEDEEDPDLSDDVAVDPEDE